MPDDLAPAATTQTPPPAAVVPPAAAVTPPPVAPPRSAPAAGEDEDTRDEDHQRAISDVRIRERKRALKELWGTSDPDEIAKIKQQRAEADAAHAKEQEELKTLRTKEDERTRAQMTEVERLQADLTTANEKITTLTAQIAAAKQEVLSERQNGAVKQAAVRHRIKPKASVMRVVLAEFGAYYLSLSGLERRRMTDPTQAERHLDRWMRGFAKENPEMCEAPAAATTTDDTVQTPAPKPAAPIARPGIRRPLGSAPVRTSQVQPRVPPGPRAPGTDENGKTVKPGLPNSMNAAELAAYKRKQGLKAS
jgi:hypothetical protein